MKLSEQIKIMTAGGADVGQSTINNWILEAERMEKKIKRNSPDPLSDESILSTYLGLVRDFGVNMGVHPDAINAQTKALVNLREMIKEMIKDEMWNDQR